MLYTFRTLADIKEYSTPHPKYPSNNLTKVVTYPLYLKKKYSSLYHPWRDITPSPHFHLPWVKGNLSNGYTAIKPYKGSYSSYNSVQNTLLPLEDKLC